ncbi:MAG: MBL fold metallo-hydrolase [Prolixibacteraceae bacterium]|jgi:hydroxyacylglutathione hydrolase|nr:MBL fold metallo-hydrolase [Prolixibacteraceae bacterium]
MKSWTLKNGSKIFQVLSGRSNVYLYQNSKQTFLFDTGKTSHYNQLIKNISSLGVEKIDWLLLTHTHFDHCQNATALKKHFNCKIGLHKNAIEFAKNGFSPLPKGTILFTKLISKIGMLVNEKKFGFLKFSPNFIFQNNSMNKDITTIHTPGHSSDSICFILENEIGIVGDTMFGVFKNSISLPYADNPDQLVKSWSKLENYNCRTFLPGHGNSIDIRLFKKQLEKHSKA